MKKVLVLLAVCFMVLGASKAFADVRSDSLNTDPRFIDSVDNIWFYPNMVNQFKNLFDTRTNFLSANNVWGGLLDGQHTGLGVIGAYVRRPFGYDGTRGWNFNSPGWFGTGSGWWGGWNIFAGNYPAAGFGGGHFAPSTPENKVDLFWGTSFDKGNFGVQINYADAEGRFNGPFYGRADQTNTNNAAAAGDASQTSGTDSRVLGANLGLGLTDAGPFSSLNVHAGYSMGSISGSEVNVRNAAGAGGAVVNNTLKDNGISTIALGALGDVKVDDNSGIKVFADAYIDSLATTEHLTFDSTGDGLHNNAADFDETFSGKYSDVFTTLGFGCNHKVLEGKATISSGFQAFWINSTRAFNPYLSQDGNTATVTTTNGQTTAGYDSATWDVVDLAWNANVEAKLASWLTARAGINRPIIWRTSTVITNNTYAANAITSTAKQTNLGDSYFGAQGSTYTMGFGINFENWELDGRVTTGSVFGTIGGVQPGKGIFFAGNIVTTTDADIRYRF